MSKEKYYVLVLQDQRCATKLPRHLSTINIYIRNKVLERLENMTKVIISDTSHQKMVGRQKIIQHGISSQDLNFKKRKERIKRNLMKIFRKSQNRKE